MYEVKHVQYDGIGLLCDEVALEFGDNGEDADKDGECETHVLQPHEWVIDVVVEDEIEYGPAIEVGGAIDIALDGGE